jgi:hypothetical protein
VTLYILTGRGLDSLLSQVQSDIIHPDREGIRQLVVKVQSSILTGRGLEVSLLDVQQSLSSKMFEMS